MTEPLDLEAIKERLAAAKAGDTMPWSPYRSLNGWHIMVNSAPDPMRPEQSPYSEADARFIAHAPTDIAALLAEVERLRIVYYEAAEQAP